MTSALRFLIGAVSLLVLFSANVYAQGIRVALLAADSSASVEDVRNTLQTQGLDVTVIDVGAGTIVPTPTTDDLAGYQAVFTWSHPSRGYADPSALGDALAGFADAGGGVVQAAYAFSPDTPLRLDGRWRTGVYEPLSLATITTFRRLEFIATQPLHPVLSGVTTFNGGDLSFHHLSVSEGCAETVANWGDTRPLVVTRVGPNGGRIVGLNMYPPSSNLLGSGNWNSMTHGGLLMANAVRFAATPAPVLPSGRPVVAVLAAEEHDWIQDVRCKIQHTGLFSRVDALDVSATVPGLAELAPYDAALTWSYLSYADSDSLGNVLADYVDQNRGVVQAATSFIPVTGLNVGGRWNSGGYRPLTEAHLAGLGPHALVPVVADHSILAGVSSVSGGEASYHSSPVAPSPGMTLVATWSDGQPLVVAGPGLSVGQIVGLNLFPPSSDVREDLWNSSTDGARMMANALLYVSNRSPIVYAGDDRAVEATSAAGVTFTLDGAATDADGDPLTFEWSGAATSSGSSIVLVVPPPATPNTMQTVTMTLTVTDGRGGAGTDTVNLTVSDTTGPVLSGIPSGTISVEATDPAGATATLGPASAEDAVDGVRPVTCAPLLSSVFPVGTTTVTCTSSDSRGNTSTSSFSVAVTFSAPDDPDDPDDPEDPEGPEDPGDVVTPGKVSGYGFIRDDDMHYEFAFTALKRASGIERGGLLLTVKSGYCSRHRHSRRRSDRFVSSTIDAVAFDGRSSVVFSGTGRWNGRSGFRYEVSAVDKVVRRRHHDVVRVTIKSATGEVVAQVNGRLSGGNVQFLRVRH